MKKAKKKIAKKKASAFDKMCPGTRAMGENIQIARVARGMSQIQFAKAVKLSQAQVSRLEQGRQGVRSGVLFRIAEALNLPAWYLTMTPDERAMVSRAGTIKLPKL